MLQQTASLFSDGWLQQQQQQQGGESDEKAGDSVGHMFDIMGTPDSMKDDPHARE